MLRPPKRETGHLFLEGRACEPKTYRVHPIPLGSVPHWTGVRYESLPGQNPHAKSAAYTYAIGATNTHESNRSITPP